jgi:hypothetical protein
VTLDPQVRKVSTACSGLFFEVSSQCIWPSKGVYDSVKSTARRHQASPWHDLLLAEGP